LKNVLNIFINIGVKSGYLPWEIHLTRKLNLISLISFLNTILAVSFFEIIGYTQFLPDLFLALLALPIVFMLNAFKNYIWAVFWFFGYAFLFFICINLKEGKDSFMILFYFPIIISMVQLLGRKETLKELYILSCFFLFSIVLLTFGFKFKIYSIDLDAQLVNNLAIFNILLSFFSTVGYILVIAWESVNQEELIKKMLKEKEILLAEVFHRVKNNMNIVTSLLNLKKNMSESIEVQSALEDCRGRVFAMALVHHNIFNNNNAIGLNFKNYVNNLVNEITSTLGNGEDFDIILETEDVNLELSNAIPCGLILNELITNSFKYGQSDNKKLQIHVYLKKHKNMIELAVKDNGPGFTKELLVQKNTLGLELIKSLSDQIGGSHTFSNNTGTIFNLKFKQAS
jgi:two-component sensor histidine kinase